MKKVKKLFLLIMLLLVLTGCGQIKSQKKVLKYAKKHYGEIELKEKNEVNKEKVIYTLKDKEYNFTYECTSSMSAFRVDGTDLFEYPDISCDFEDKYKEYIYSEIKKDSSIKNQNLLIKLPKYSDEYYDGKDDMESFDIYTDDLNDENTYKKILKRLQEIDDRKYFKDFAFEIYNKNTEDKLGVITTKDYKLLTNKDESEKKFTYYANRTFSTDGKEDSGEIEFIRKEENVKIKDRKEIYEGLLKMRNEGLKEELENATTTIYYFYDNVAKIDFYIIDYYVFGQACFFNNYSANVRNEYTEQTFNGCRW